MAIKYLKKAITLLPNYVDILVSYGNICLNIGDFGSAKEWFQRAAEINPKYKPLIFTLLFNNIYIPGYEPTKSKKLLKKSKNFHTLWNYAIYTIDTNEFEVALLHLFKRNKMKRNYYLSCLFDRSLISLEYGKYKRILRLLDSYRFRLSDLFNNKDLEGNVIFVEKVRQKLAALLSANEIGLEKRQYFLDFAELFKDRGEDGLSNGYLELSKIS